MVSDPMHLLPSPLLRGLFTEFLWPPPNSCIPLLVWHPIKTHQPPSKLWTTTNWA